MLRVKRREEGRAINDIIAPNIRKIIKEKGLKQSAVAQKSGYSQQQFNPMLTGRKTIKDVDVINIKNALGVNISTLFGESEEKK